MLKKRFCKKITIRKKQKTQNIVIKTKNNHYILTKYENNHLCIDKKTKCAIYNYEPTQKEGKMAGQLNIFDSMIASLNQEAKGLQQTIADLEKKNAEFNEEIKSSQKYLDESDDWHDRNEYERDIRYCEGQIAANNKLIADYRDHIQKINNQIREYTDFTRGANDKLNSRQK